MSDERRFMHIDSFDKKTIELIKKQKINDFAFTCKFSGNFTPKTPFDLKNLLQFSDTLERLSLYGGDYINLEVMFNQMPKLRSIDVDTQKIDFSLIVENLIIEYLGSHGTRTKEWNGITKLKNLKELRINGNIVLENIDFLQQLNNLERVNLHNCSKITRFPDLRGLTKLNLINAQMCNRLEDISELKKLENVRVGVSGKMIKGGYYNTVWTDAVSNKTW